MRIVYIYIYMLSKQQLTTDKIYYSIEKTNPSSYRRGGPLPNWVVVKYENKNMVTGPDGALHQEPPCWRMPAVSYCCCCCEVS
jgi:hypothetical protein